MRKFYDPEYDRIVDETVPKSQYEYFRTHGWSNQSYEEFLTENFVPEEDKENHIPFRML